MMLESIKLAYDRVAFTAECPCPIDLNTTELYLQILKPAFTVSLTFQKNSSTIADTIRCILKLIEYWEKMSKSNI